MDLEYMGIVFLGAIEIQKKSPNVADRSRLAVEWVGAAVSGPPFWLMHSITFSGKPRQL